MIERLENNEQILLMYLADELPAEDRAEVEQMLKVDASLGRELKGLRAAQERVHETLGRLDDLSPLPVSVDFAARQVGREIRRELARPKIQYAAPVQDRQVRSWRWLYPTVAAASIAIIGMVWLGREATPSNPVAVTGPTVLPRMPYNGAGQFEGQPMAKSDDALLIDTLQREVSGLESAEAKSASDPGPGQLASSGDVMPHDEVSQYLLNIGAGGQ